MRIIEGSKRQSAVHHSLSGWREIVAWSSIWRENVRRAHGRCCPLSWSRETDGQSRLLHRTRLWLRRLLPMPSPSTYKHQKHSPTPSRAIGLVKPTLKLGSEQFSQGSILGRIEDVTSGGISRRSCAGRHEGHDSGTVRRHDDDRRKEWIRQSQISAQSGRGLSERYSRRMPREW